MAAITLESRAPALRNGGMSAMEVVAWLAGELPSQSPRCASPVIAAFVASCNDRWPDDARQLLKPYLPRIVGTRSAPAPERVRAYLLVDRAVRLWAVSAARTAGNLAQQWGTGIRARAEQLAAVHPVTDWSSAVRAAVVAYATVSEIQRVSALTEACAAAEDNATASACAGAHRVAAAAPRFAAYAAQAVAAGASELATAGATAAVEAAEASGLAAVNASGDGAYFNRRETVVQSLDALDDLIDVFH